MPGLLLGLAAKKQHGKDTMADYLIETRGFVKLSFADPMKRSAAAALGITVEHLEAMKENPDAFVGIGVRSGGIGVRMTHAITVREYLQKVGTEAHRSIPEFGQDVWINMMEQKVDRQGMYVITDARFENEQNQIHLLGGYVVQINRPGMPTGDGHKSEQIDHGLADFVIENDGDLVDLKVRIDLVLEKIRALPFSIPAGSAS